MLDLELSVPLQFPDESNKNTLIHTLHSRNEYINAKVETFLYNQLYCSSVENQST